MIQPMMLTVTIKEVCDSASTLGFVVGLCVAAVVVVILEIIRQVRNYRRAHAYVSIPNDNDGEFRLSYNAVRSQVSIKLKRLFPELSVRKILLCRKGSGMKMTVKAQTSEMADIKALHDTVKSAIQQILEDEDGFVGVFKVITIEIDAIDDKTPKSIGATKLMPPKVDESLAEAVEPVSESSDDKEY